MPFQKKPNQNKKDRINLLSITLKADRSDVYCRLSQQATAWSFICVLRVKSNMHDCPMVSHYPPQGTDLQNYC